MALNEQYKLYVLDGLNCNKSTIHGKLFLDMLSVRISGYHKYYGNRLMPIDLYDHFSSHLILCKKKDRAYIPVSCVRSIAYSSCLENGIEFLPVSRVSVYSPHLVNSIKELTDQHKNITYDSGLTINPLIVSPSESYEIIKYMIGATLNYHKERNTNVFIVSAIKKTKTDRLFKKVGFHPISQDSSYKLKGLEKDDFMLMKYTGDNIYSSNLKKETRSIWNNRIEISSIDETERYSVAIN